MSGKNSTKRKVSQGLIYEIPWDDKRSVNAAQNNIQHLCKYINTYMNKYNNEKKNKYIDIKFFKNNF